ncbi:MAG: phage Gp37/Gp68 family protein [Kofleriaceae bacterium]|nr:phage Gp37/Gp68 family protein [Myxococcales bacterium]MCB9559176.1 phage Gp37/Gp68 family protein [Kofleriaceae bacterium]
MSRSSIEWTDETWNPVTGCEKVSPGCKHCYAERFAERFRGVDGHPYQQGFDPQLRPDRVEQPRAWKSPRMVFVNSMSDLFGDFVPDSYLAKVFRVMRDTPQHTYQILTKRAERLETWTRSQRWLLTASNIWLGVSVEDRKYGVPRIGHLQKANAACRFLSVEPLLEGLGTLDLAKIDWVIAGGESGPGARPMQLEWVRSVRDQCIKKRVAFFFKQWGGVQKHRSGRVLDGRTWDEIPERSRLEQSPLAAR